MDAQFFEWLDPWWSVAGKDESFRETFSKQFEREVPPGHLLYGLPVRLVARGNGDDCLFEIVDGSGRFAYVHLTWSKGPERLPWPDGEVFESLGEFRTKRMLVDHQDFEE
jgi:hypothetical protein